MRFNHTDRKGFLIGLVDLFTAGLFLLFYMPRGLQDELDEILGCRTQRYYIAYLLGIPTLFIYTLVWFSRVAEGLRIKALELGIEGNLTSFKHAFLWNIPGGFIIVGPAIATLRFFDTLNKIELELNRRQNEADRTSMPQRTNGHVDS